MDNLKNVVVIFDLDGTLVDTAGDLAASMNEVLVKNGREAIDPVSVRHMVGQGARVMLSEGFARTGPPADEAHMPAYLAQFIDHYMANIAVFSRPFEGATACLEEFRAAGARLAICTNKREALARALLDALELTAFFDVIVGFDTASAPKPDPAPVHLCLQRAGCSRGVFIGDSDTDIKAAIAADMPCLLHLKGYGPAQMARGAFAGFNHYRDLPGLAFKALA